MVQTGDVTDRWTLSAGLGAADLKISGRGRAGETGFDGDVTLAVPDPARLDRLTTIGPLTDLLRAPIRVEATLAATPTSATGRASATGPGWTPSRSSSTGSPPSLCSPR